MTEVKLMTARHLLACATLALALAGPAPRARRRRTRRPTSTTSVLATGQARGQKAAGQGVSNERIPSPPRLEDSLPLAGEADRAKSSKILQQTTVHLLTLFNDYKQAHWNLNGPLYISLHEYYQIRPTPIAATRTSSPSATCSSATAWTAATARSPRPALCRR